MRKRGRRNINHNFNDIYFKPRGIRVRDIEEILITKSDLEALRLKYKEKLTQELSANKMGISQSQFQRDIVSVLERLTDALIEGKAIHIID